MKFNNKTKLNEYEVAHQKIAADGSLNNLRATIDSIIKESRKKYSKTDNWKIHHQLEKYDEFFMIHLLFANDGITKALIKSRLRNTKLRYPIKKDWFEIFERFGFNLDQRICQLMFQTFVIRVNFRQILKFIKSWFDKPEPVNLKGCAIILGTNQSNYLQGDLNNFGKWILSKIIKSNYSSVYVEIEFRDESKLIDQFCYIKNFEDRVVFNSIWEYIVLLIKFRKIANTKKIYFKYPKLALQSFLVKYTDCNLPKTVFVPSSLPWIKTPFFHFMEAKGTEFKYVNLSLAMDPEINMNNAKVDWSDYSEWKEVWCVSDAQNNYLSSRIGMPTSTFLTSGVPDWTDLSDEALVKKLSSVSKSLAIFDYTPKFSYFGYSSLNDLNLSSERTILQFIDDLYLIASKYGFCIFHKPKRNINKKLKNYVSHLENLNRNYKYFHLVQPDISPRRLIKYTSATVSIPFTSTNLIAIEENKQNAFYDPNGNVSKDDLASSNSDVLLGKDELEMWVGSLTI
jgi:hypothetical protein